jgi:PAS domain S-box-containing protein
MNEAAPAPEAVILYAEDTEPQRYAISRFLRRAGFDVLEAGTGGEALKLMGKRPDVVVLDVNLPDISGLEVCRQIKCNELTSRTPVLHVSAALVSTQARVAGLEGGADGYLVQPVEPEELVATIRALLRVRKAEEELWVSKQQYRSFFEANPLACLVFDTEDKQILAVNAAAVDQYGYSRDEFMDLPVRDLALSSEEGEFSDFVCSESVHLYANRTWKHKTRAGVVIAAEIICSRLDFDGRNARLMIVQDVTEKLKRQEAEQNEKLRRLLLERLMLAQEEERQRIARELHDHTGQLMTSLLVGLRTVSDSRKLADAKQKAHRLREIASDAIGELGRLARGLHSSVLDDLGLREAIERHAEEFSSSQGIKVNLSFNEVPLAVLKKEEQINLYRIMQEALTNVARHSRASEVKIGFTRMGSELLLVIADNGIGLLPARSADLTHHLGIEGMRQRAAMLRGSLELQSEPPRGFCVQVRMPFPATATRERKASATE